MPLITCPDCNNQVSDAAASCPHCGRPLLAARNFSATRKTNASQSAKSSKVGKAMLYGCLITFACLLVIAIGSNVLIKALTDGSKSSVNSKSSSSSSSSRSYVLTGKEGTLDNGEPTVTIAEDEEALDAMVHAAAIKDNIGFDQLVSTRAFVVQSGTKALVIGGTLMKKEVRILEGEHKGEVGWIPHEWIK